MGEFVRSGSGNAKGGSNISFPPHLQLAPRRWGQRGQSVAALTARGSGLDCFQPQPWQLVSTRSSRAPCAFPNLRCYPRCWLFSCLGFEFPTPLISPKEHQKERCGHFRSQRSFITFYGALRNILLSAGFPAMFHMIILEQTFVNGPLQKIFSCCCF